MESVLDRIKSLPGVSCVFYFDPQFGTVSRKGGDAFVEENLSTVGKNLEKFYTWGAELFSDIQQIRLQYDETSISIRRAKDNRYLVIFHQSPLDENLIGLILSQSSENRGTQTNFATGDADARSSTQDAPTQKAEAMLRSQPVSQLLSLLETTLNKVMGPMAAIVFSDTRQTWLSGIEQVNRASIEKLILMLCAEIGDKDKIATFKSLIAPI